MLTRDLFSVVNLLVLHLYLLFYYRGSHIDTSDDKNFQNVGHSAVRNLELSKFAHLVTLPVSVRDSASS